MKDIPGQYYQSHTKLGFIGPDGQLKLNNAKVLVIGAGGLGCPCLLNLAGCGIGTIGIADFDIVSISNLHRQTLYGFDDVGKKKVVVAQQKLLNKNSYIAIKQHDILVNESNILGLISDYDMVVDGTDNFAVRYLINDACVYLNKALIYGAIYQTEGHVTVFNHYNSATLRCLFPEPSVETHIPSCAEVGAYNGITGIIGLMMANEVVKVILDNKNVLVNKLVSYDSVSLEKQTISYRHIEANRQISLNRFNTNNNVTDISVDEFLSLKPDTYHLIDVRESWEHDEFNIGGLNISVAIFKQHDFSGLAKSDKLILYCSHGQRSQSAAQFLRQNGFVNAVSLRGGLNAYLAAK